MGATGPCGPCTEIHYDRIGGRDAGALVNADRPDVIEIWNNVFIQFNREADGSLRELPAKHVDTGMGFERLASILQGKDSNYDTDIFVPIFAAIQKITGARPYAGKLGAEDQGLVDMAYRVVADHIRTLTFAITDGAVPSNDGRGYVLRRILRRAVRYGQEMLNAPSGFFAKLVPVVVKNFSDAFPELIVRQDYVIGVISEEEQSFIRTLDQGVKHFKKVIASLEAAGAVEKVIPAKDCHILYSSMGFPLDLTELMAEERGFKVDKAGFEDLMEHDRKISEAAEMLRKGGDTKDMSMAAEQTSYLQGQGIATTDSDFKYTWNISLDARVEAIYFGRAAANSGFASSASSQDGLVGLVLNKTSYYYESGGQTYDTGLIVIKKADGSEVNFNVTNVQTYAGFVVHVGTVVGDAKVDIHDAAQVKVDYDRRSFIAPNHTMTHVLNFALRHVLITQGDNVGSGVNVDQKGSLVDTEKLRFDFSWSSALSSAQVKAVEDIVNDRIRQSVPVFAEVVPLSSASNITALRKVFGETYPDPVRVVSVGSSVPDLLANPSSSEWGLLSIEFCGGTHLTNTSQAEDFVIVEESGIAKGIRRIVGLTRKAAKEARNRAKDLLDRITVMEHMPGGNELIAAFKTIKIEVDQALVSLVEKDVMKTKLAAVFETIKAYNKANAASKLNAANIKADEVAAQSKTNGKALIVASIDFGADGKVAKKIHDKLKATYAEGSFFIASFDDDMEKVGAYPIVSTAHQAQGVSAKEWVDYVIAKLGVGKGGGKAETANASIPGGQEVMDQIIVLAGQYAEEKMAGNVYTAK